MRIHNTFIGAMLHCILFSDYHSQEISDSPKILKFDAHVKKNCTNIKFSINDTVLGYGEVLIISISLQSISGQYSGIRLLTNKARVDVIGKLYE